MKKIITVAIYIFCAILLVLAFAILMPIFDKMRKTQATIYELENELASKKAEIQMLREEFHGLHSDPETIEKVAREKYNFCRSGEIIYRYTAEDIVDSQLVGPVGIEPTTR